MNSLSNRTFYPCLSDYNYLNQASLGLIGEPAVQAMNGFLNEIARFGNIKMSDQEEVQFFDPLRKNAAQLFNTSAEQVAILSSASEMLAQLPYIFKPKKNTTQIYLTPKNTSQTIST